MNKEEKNSQIFHDRAYNATLEIRKILMSLSTGILAVYFFSLTQEIKPSLNIPEKNILALNIILFSFSILFGLLAWFSDNKRFFFKAKELDNPNEKEKYTKDKDLWFRMRRRSDILFTLYHRNYTLCNIFNLKNNIVFYSQIKNSMTSNYHIYTRRTKFVQPKTIHSP